MYGTCDAVRTRFDLTNFEAQQPATRLNVDQKAAVVHGVLQGRPVLLGGLYTDVVVLDVGQADIWRTSEIGFSESKKL